MRSVSFPDIVDIPDSTIPKQELSYLTLIRTEALIVLLLHLQADIRPLVPAPPRLFACVWSSITNSIHCLL